VPETSEPVTEDPMDKILAYLYNLQDFDFIKKELNNKNVVPLYAMAYILEMPKLLQDLEDYIIDEVLVDESQCVRFYNEGIRFDNKRIIHFCEELIKKNFDKLCVEGKHNTQ
jgi:hypothetical protein